MLWSTWVRVKAPLMPEVALVELPPKKPERESQHFGVNPPEPLTIAEQRELGQESQSLRSTYPACRELPRCHRQGR